MAIDFQSLEPRSQRRLRLIFTNSLDSGAFLPSWFTLTCLDGSGMSPDVVAVLPVPGTPNGAELVLDADLVSGGLYEVEIAAGLPAVDLSTHALTTFQFRTAVKPISPSLETTEADLFGLFYGIDLAHNGDDFVEQANGDLASESGPAHMSATAKRGLLSSGLPWAPEWGARLREHVDAPITTLGRVRSAAVRYFRSDDRYQRADISPLDHANDGDAVLLVDYWLVGDVHQQVQVER